MERERIRPEPITAPEHYWHDAGVVRAVLHYLGGAGRSWSALESIASEYLVTTNWQKWELGGSPASSIAPCQLPAKLAEQQGLVDLAASLWHKDDPERAGYPTRTLLVWDIQRFSQDKAEPFRQPGTVLDQVAPVIGVFEAALAAYGIPFLSVVTGRGVHLVTAVPASSAVMDALIQIGQVLEPTVLAKQAGIPERSASKRRRPVPVASELSFKGAVRLQQFVITQLIRPARQVASLPVEISDIGPEGIAVDNTVATGTVDTRLIGVVGSQYKPQHMPWSASAQVIIRIPRKGPGFELPLAEVLRIRDSWSRAAAWLGDVDCRIPDGSGGMRGLIHDYYHSDLYQLHQAMDRSFGDEPEAFGWGYRNYEAVARHTRDPRRIGWLITHANHALLQPGNLDYFIWEIFQAWGGSRENLAVAPHVAGLLRAIYEDPRFGWGRRWLRHDDALRHARGWVELTLGKMFEQ